MSTLRNSVQLIGNIGKAPELKTASNGNKYAMFSLATTESYTNKAGEKVKDTTWHNIIVWDKQAEIASKYLNVGSQVGITAKLVNKEYADKDGNKQYRYELRVSELTMLSASNKTPQSQMEEKVLVAADSGDDLPF
jgi:single-strand DNA-binding protein